jgi:hypothetical protein
MVFSINTTRIVKTASEQTCIIENAGGVIINVGGIDMKGKPYGAVNKKKLKLVIF